MFTKLRGATVERLDGITATFTADDWEDLESGPIQALVYEVMDHMDVLGVDAGTDSVLMFCLLYQRILARNPEVAP
jgi:hypothetical protein